MKTKRYTPIVAMLFAMYLPLSALSQCGTMHTITYDTTVTGVGTQNPPYNFTIPRFNSTLGTLLSVNISARVTLGYQYSIENTQGIPLNTIVRFNRNDLIMGTALPLGFLMYDTSTAPVLHSLQASDGVPNSGPDYMAHPAKYMLNNSLIINQTLSNTADFMGLGNLNFTYQTGLYVIKDNTSILNSTAEDNITFSVTYTYCDNIIMRPTERPVLTPERFTGSGSRLFPNPVSGGNVTLQLDAQQRGNWKVDILNMAGQVVSSQQVQNATTVPLNSSRLSAGIYMVRAVNSATQQSFTERLVVR